MIHGIYHEKWIVGTVDGSKPWFTHLYVAYLWLDIDYYPVAVCDASPVPKEMWFNPAKIGIKSSKAMTSPTNLKILTSTNVA